MARAKRANGPIKRREKKEPPDKQKSPPVEKPKANDGKGPKPKQDLDNVKRKREQGVPAQRKRSKMDRMDRDGDAHDEDLMHWSIKSDTSSDSEEGDESMSGQRPSDEDPNTSQGDAGLRMYRKDIIENESFEESSSAENEQNSETIKGKREEGLPSPRKKWKRLDSKDEDWLPGSDESEEDHEEADDAILGAIYPDAESEPKLGQDEVQDARLVKIENNVWKRLDVPGDGDCQFSTYSVLNGQGISQKRKMRQDIVNAAIDEQWNDDIKEGIKANHFSSPEFENMTDAEIKQLYKVKMGTSGVYGSEVEILVAGRILPTAFSYIQEYSDPGPNQKQYRVCNVDPLSEKPRKWMFYSGDYVHGLGHYEPLEPVGIIEPLENGMYDAADRSPGSLKRNKDVANTVPKPMQKIVDVSKNDKQDPVKCVEEGCLEKFMSSADYFAHLFKEHGKKEWIPDKKLGKRYQCPHPNCFSKPAINEEQRKQHFRSKHFNKQMVCPVRSCRNEFSHRSYLKRHINQVHKGDDGVNDDMKWSSKQDKEPEKCASRATKTVSQNEIMQFQKSIKCAVEGCQEEFDASINYLNHFFDKHGKKRKNTNKGLCVTYPCPFPGCKKETTEKRPRSKHFRDCHFQTTIICQKPGCLKSFKGKGNYLEHLKSHNKKKKSAIKIVKCVVEGCTAEFDEPANYLNHLINKHGKKKTIPDEEFGVRWPCPYPGCEIKPMQRRSSRCNHFRQRHFDEPMVCQFPGCSETFREKGNFLRHLKTHNINKPINDPVKCAVEGCPKEFKNHDEFLNHLYDEHDKPRAELNNGMSTWPCPHPYCVSKPFYSAAITSTHFQLQHFDKPYFCKEPGCGKSFIKKLSVSIHRCIKVVPSNEPKKERRTPRVQIFLQKKTNPEKMKHSCHQEGCTKVFATEKGLYSHLVQGHWDLEPFKCLLSSCNKVCANYKKLKLHMSEGHGRKIKGMKIVESSKKALPFKCPECGRRFNFFSRLQRHMNDIHTKSKNYNCTYQGCTKAFKHKSSLTRHIEKVHKYYAKEDASSSLETVSGQNQLTGVKDEQILHHLEQRLLDWRCNILQNMYTVYFVIGITHQLLLNEEGVSIQPTRQWLQQLDAKESVTTLSLYVGACEKGEISKYHSSTEEAMKSSIKNYVKKGEGKAYKIATINCETKEEMLIVEAAAQEFIRIRYLASCPDPSATGIVFKPMWVHTSKVYIDHLQKTEENGKEVYLSFSRVAKRKSKKVFCFKEQCYEPFVEAQIQRHKPSQFPFEGLVHVEETFKQV